MFNQDVGNQIWSDSNLGLCVDGYSSPRRSSVKFDLRPSRRLSRFSASVLSLYSANLGNRNKILFASCLMVLLVGITVGACIVKYFICKDLTKEIYENSTVFNISP